MQRCRLAGLHLQRRTQAQDVRHGFCDGKLRWRPLSSIERLPFTEMRVRGAHHPAEAGVQLGGYSFPAPRTPSPVNNCAPHARRCDSPPQPRRALRRWNRCAASSFPREHGPNGIGWWRAIRTRTRVAFVTGSRKTGDKRRRNVLKVTVGTERDAPSGCTRQVLMVCCRSAENE